MRLVAQYFRIEEFAYSSSYPKLVRPVPAHLFPNVQRLVDSSLDAIRERWGAPIKILSGYRPEALNKAVGGSPTSQHLLAQAADITTKNVYDLFTALMMARTNFNLGQVIVYPGRQFIHLALPSRKYPSVQYFVNAPNAGLNYYPVRTIDEAQAAINKGMNL